MRALFVRHFHPFCFSHIFTLFYLFNLRRACFRIINRKSGWRKQAAHRTRVYYQSWPDSFNFRLMRVAINN